MSKRAEEFEKIFNKLLVGDPIIFDDKGNLVEVCDILPATCVECIEYKKFTFEDLKKALEDLSSHEQEK